MKKAIVAVWQYFAAMNSEKDGVPSIKRNVAWGIATLLVFVEVFTLVALYYLIQAHIGQSRLIDVFEYLAMLFVIVNATMILLTLRITSIEKITTLAGTLKGTTKNDQPVPEKDTE